jgi:hypothetical protein
VYDVNEKERERKREREKEKNGILLVIGSGWNMLEEGQRKRLREVERARERQRERKREEKKEKIDSRAANLRSLVLLFLLRRKKKLLDE